jgi:hypothetical protein
VSTKWTSRKITLTGALLLATLAVVVLNPAAPLHAGNDGGGGLKKVPGSGIPMLTSDVMINVAGVPYEARISAETTDGQPYIGSLTNQNILVSWTCARPGEGAGSSSSTMLSSEGYDQLVQIVCADAIGNTGTVTVSGYSIDRGH